MLFSCSTILLPEVRELPEVARMIAGAGYDGIEWRVQSDYHIDPKAIDKVASNLKAICREHQLKIAGLATYLNWTDKEDIHRVVDAAASMGCPRIRVGGFNYNGTENFQTVYERALKQIDSVLKSLEQVGVKLLIETHFGTIHASAHGALNVVRQFDSTRVGVILDGANLSIEGWENWQMGIELLGDYLDHVHVRSTAWYHTPEKGWHWRRTPLGQGMTDWKVILGVLRERGYAGFVSNENIYGVPTSSKGYIGESHGAKTVHDDFRTIDQRLNDDLTYLRSLVEPVSA